MTEAKATAAIDSCSSFRYPHWSTSRFILSRRTPPLGTSPFGDQRRISCQLARKRPEVGQIAFYFFLNLKVQWSSWTAFWQDPALVSLSGRAMSAPKIQLLLNLWACNILEYPRAILNSGPKICLVDFSYQSRNCQACFKSHQNTSNTFVVNKGNKIKF